MKITKIKGNWRILFKPKKNGKYYITSCGWRNFGSVHEGAVSISELEWVEE